VIETIAAFPLAAAASPDGPPIWIQFAPILVVFAIFYFIAIAPMRKQQKERQRAIEALSRGDRVVTKGGLFGEVVSIDTDSVVLKISEDTKVKVAKWGLESAVGTPEARKKP
jgi:preprotein translocase subunit YajC